MRRAPRVRLDARDARPGEAVLDFGGRLGARAARPPTSICRRRRDLDEAAANLFGFLRGLDAGAARPHRGRADPDDGLGEAINDRLARAPPRPRAGS